MDTEKIFLNYLKQYDQNDDKIHLKIVHTWGVVQAIDFIVSDMNLKEEDKELARLIALLHDIGRFEQLKKYHTFDDTVMPHAQCSVDILFRDGLIREFVADRNLDTIIYNAIRLHGVYRIDDSMYRLYRKQDIKEWEKNLPVLKDEELLNRVKLHTKLIRDADKVDNFRVKSMEEVRTMVDVTEYELGNEAITESIYDTFMAHTPILNSSRVTHMDMWVSYLGYLFDFNFNSGLKYILEQDYINKIVDRISYTNQDTRKKMEAIRKEALSYIEGRIKTKSDESMDGRQ